MLHKDGMKMQPDILCGGHWLLESWSIIPDRRVMAPHMCYYVYFNLDQFGSYQFGTNMLPRRKGLTACNGEIRSYPYEYRDVKLRGHGRRPQPNPTMHHSVPVTACTRTRTRDRDRMHCTVRWLHTRRLPVECRCRCSSYLLCWCWVSAAGY